MVHKRQQRADTANISNPFQRYSIGCKFDVISAVVKNKDFDSFKLIIDYLANEKPKRVGLPQIALTKIGTG